MHAPTSPRWLWNLLRRAEVWSLPLFFLGFVAGSQVVCYTVLKSVPLLLQANVHDRILASLHALVAGSWAAWSVVWGYSPKTMRWLMCFTRGYICFDTWLLFTSGEEGLFLKLAHHAVLGGVTFYFIKYAPYMAVGFLSELTTPLLHYGKYLWDMGWGQNMFFHIGGAGLLFVYFWLRIANFSYILYKLFRNPASNWFERLGFGSLTLLNCYWYTRLIGKVTG